jgi:hypothetical protein
MSDQPVAWAMPRKDGLILDVICPEEHAREPGQYTVPLYTRPYDQQALELCEVCGWKTMIPTEGCLNCERQPKAEPVAWWIPKAEQFCVKTPGERPFAKAWQPLYAAPQPRRRLTDDEIALIVAECAASAHRRDDFSFARAIEDAIWSKK